jgi:hypothetical protein
MVKKNLRDFTAPSSCCGHSPIMLAACQSRKLQFALAWIVTCFRNRVRNFPWSVVLCFVFLQLVLDVFFYLFAFFPTVIT